MCEKAFGGSLKEWLRRFSGDSSSVHSEFKQYKPMRRDCLWCSPQRSTQSLLRRSLLYEHRPVLWFTPTCNFICSRS
jgi:hypothetical protein